MSIKQNIEHLRYELPSGVCLVAVSKTHPSEMIMEAYNSSQRVFGENRVQELVSKYEQLPKDIEWHMIGSLQTNKVKYIAPFVSLVHSVDSSRLLDTIDKEAAKYSRIIDVLFEIYVAKEHTKHGWNFQELAEYLSSQAFLSLRNVRVRGVMAMASFTSDEEQVRSEFRQVFCAFKGLKDMIFVNNDNFDTVSMGMSGDWRIAVEEGASMLRIGRTIFGER